MQAGRLIAFSRQLAYQVCYRELLEVSLGDFHHGPADEGRLKVHEQDVPARAFRADAPAGKAYIRILVPEQEPGGMTLRVDVPGWRNLAYPEPVPSHRA